jgi:hypothetical protein
MTGRPKGFPKTGGRKCGTPNKRTLALEQAAAEAAGKIASALGDTAFEGDAHSLLMYKDTSKPSGVVHPGGEGRYRFRET